jgi:opine dehydrogenase
MSGVGTITIVGGGNGAFAAAAHLALEGFRVNLCDPYDEGSSLKALMDAGKLGYVGVCGEGYVVLNRVTSRPEQVVPEADLILVCVPSTAHDAMARWLAPVLPEDTTLLLNPGHTGGALHFRQALSREGFSSQLTLGETNTLTYIARKKDPTTVNITSVASNVRVAALPASSLEALLARAGECYPHLRPTKTVLGTSLRNVNAMMHPPGMILGAAWIEHTSGDFCFYYDAATPAVGRLMQAIDDERLAIAAAWNEPVEPLIDLLASIGTTTEEAQKSGSLQRAFLESKPNRWIKAPSSLDDRYMHEDFPYGLVPMVALGKIVGVDAPVMRSLIRLASVINDVDYWSKGLTIDRLGLEGKTLEEVHTFLEHGE